MQTLITVLARSAVAHDQRRAGLLCGAVILTLLPLLGTAQTVYRSVDANGKVTFSDKPPANAARVSTAAEASVSTSSNPALPFELRQVVARYPVTLFTGKDCEPCDNGRDLLRRRGVPFTEKTISSSADTASLQRLSGSSSLPFLTLGTQQIRGFAEAEWTQYLSAAGYPEKSKLPATYRNPAATPLVAEQSAPAAANPNNARASQPRATTRPLPATPAPANPAGIKF
ncbi:MAG: glutaredoxin family protein [Rhodoferax sp.]|jgi:glutaredoxin|uniref:glutaredoxin family protein n=1 Tax=Rhodoferax sp. TaxID=50421 RepID=UPI001B434ACF|nr:glutaredoxin family protein [Rhodoferax sp.]MBP8285790.1 glutaredoxin family protein [Rhodoferax sp.]MBP9148529.1 glutaredoxin family protein [Rhodoferax sp.]MBP9735249.1 glutaredoxin family protein [Rhodoferax sp.]